jgi:CubicO group peptidase (beta-lactamase class C family)
MTVVRFIAATALFAAVPLAAQNNAARIDSIFSFATSQTPGCAVGVSQKGQTTINKAYGLADIDKQTPLSQSSLFDIGSTQKQFTATSILLLAQDGRLSLTDDIHKFLPELPRYEYKVTIDNLLTHTSGIRDWTGILPMAAEGTDVATLLLRQRGLNFAPGTEWLYSNGGFELAKLIVARASGMSFADFTRKRIFEPLGMKSTAYVADILQAGSNASFGYQKDGASWKPYMRLGNNRGGGAIVSNIGDMLIWQNALEAGKLGKRVTAQLHEQTKLSNGRTLDYARGVIVEHTPGGVVISHSGGAAGFSTWMGRVPQHGLAVAVSCNFDPVSASNLAAKVADVFLPPVDSAALARDRARRPVAAPGIDVSGRAGLFFDAKTGEPMRLELTNGRLAISNAMPLVPVSATTFRPSRPSMFFRSADDFVLTFVDPDHIEIKSMEGIVSRFNRAQPMALSAADLHDLDGRYESSELGSIFEIVPGNNSVAMRFENAREKSVEFTPVARDVFMARMMVVRFQRDANGKVKGFTYENPVAKGIQFVRAGERKADEGSAAASPLQAASPKLENLVGEYEMAPGRTITITLENGQLQGQPTGSSKRPLVFVSGTTFGVGSADAPASLTFTVGADGRATSMVMKQGDRERTLTRIK